MQTVEQVQPIENNKVMQLEVAEPEPVQSLNKEPIFGLEERLLQIFSDTSLSQTELSERIKGVMSTYLLTEKDWQKYCFFNDLHYTRNLVVTNDKFELIVLCWKAGQASRIHNHSNSNCWMGVALGPMVETLYSKVVDGKVVCEKANPSQPGECPNLRLDKTSLYQTGEVGYIHDGLGLHRVAATPDYDGVSIHCYSPPISVATLFDTETNSVVQRTPGFFSIGGKRLC